MTHPLKDFKDGITLTKGGYLQPEAKAEAIALLRAGNSVAKVSRQTGIHIESVRRWSKDLRT